jgi:hypothetical protein
VTHADLRQRLRAYADGTLDDGEADVVRAHLGTGCLECLRDVFTRPVGLPRAPVVLQRVSGRLLVAVGLTVAAIIASVAVILGTMRVPPRAGDGAIEKLAAELERMRVERERSDATARERLARLEAQIVEAERRPAPAGTAAADPRPSDDPVLDPATVPKWLEELLSTTGARAVPLGPAASAPGARGFAVWSPVRSLVVVSASDLPASTRETVYRVRVTMNDGSTVWLGDLSASDRRALLVTVALPDAAGRRVRGVDLYRDPPSAPILTARLRP